MLKAEIFAAEQHTRFIYRVIASGQVWVLTTNGQFVFSNSNEDGNEDTDILTVWSDKAYAKRCAIEDWQEYIPESIALAEFLESWCAGLHNNQELVGTNWDTDLHGLEVEPLGLALEILVALKAAVMQITFQNYGSMQEFEEAIRRNIG